MRVIIAGGRNITSRFYLEKAIELSGFKIDVVLSGHARGADILGEQWAQRNNVPLELYAANWPVYNLFAGFKRNEEMAEVADALIALWDGKSKGTKNMIDIARKKGLAVFVFRTDQWDF